MYILEIILKVINKLATVLHLPKDKLRGGLCAVLSKRVEVDDSAVCLNAMTHIMSIFRTSKLMVEDTDRKELCIMKYLSTLLCLKEQKSETAFSLIKYSSKNKQH